ncbi:MAG: hypothetical protein P4L50_11870 [Anaerolineaceae bacterium]|nr:hypothetical protein [Anaerolineaceae bacterium]
MKKSTIPNAGNGLFTTVPRKTGNKITNYAGTNTGYTREDRERGHLFGGDYVLEMPTRPPTYFNPFRTTDSAGRYSNMARRGDGKANNAGIGYSQRYHQPFLKAIHPIPNATKQHPRELLATYGRNYWQ